MLRASQAATDVANEVRSRCHTSTVCPITWRLSVTATRNVQIASRSPPMDVVATRLKVPAGGCTVLPDGAAFRAA